MEQVQKRNKWIRMRLTEAEAQAIEELSRQSSCFTISEYCRRTLLKKPRFVRRQNKSAKDFQAEMLILKRALNEAADNMGLVADLLSSPSQPPEIQMWGQINREDETRFRKKIDELFQIVDKIYKLWSHE